MSNRIITISREFGSGGRTIGRKTAQRLGIACYDRELIEKIAQESGFAETFIAEKTETASHGYSLFSMLSERDMNGNSIHDYLWKIQLKVILEIAEKESCVIVGRCADYILKDRADCLRVFIHADMDKRAERIVNQYGERTDTPQKRIKDKDTRRRAYYQFYTGEKWDNVKNYDIALNSGVIGTDNCVEILTKLY